MKIPWLNKTIILAVLGMAGLFIFTPSIYAVDTVPLNGTFDGDVRYWMKAYYKYSDAYNDGSYAWTSSGHSGGGLYLSGGEVAVLWSMPVNVGDNAILTYWHNGGGRNCWFQVLDGSSTTVNATGTQASGWEQVSIDLAGQSGKIGRVECQVSGYWSSGSSMYLDDVSISNSTNYIPNAYLNGTFLNSKKYWWAAQNANISNDSTWGSPINSLAYSLSNDPNKTYSFNSIPFVPAASPLTAWMKSSGSGADATMCVQDISAGQNGWSCYGTYSFTDTNAHQVSFDFTPYVGETIQLQFRIHANWWGGFTYNLDEVCAGNCLNGTPTPTPASTATSGGGGNGSPITVVVPTIDWTNYPTPAPYPTFPPMIGPGTVVPIQGGNSTPVWVYANGTPIPVVIIQPTPTATATRMNLNPSAPGVAQPSFGSASSVAMNLSNPKTKADLNLSSSTNDTSPGVDFRMETTHIGYTWDLGGVGGLPNVTLDIAYTYISYFKIGPVDIYPAIKGLVGVYLLVFIIRKIQKR